MLMSPMGLSPRVRGNLVTTMGVVLPLGSIPACAGEPITRIPSPSINEVYPRVCGGTPDALSALALNTGLSPRVRGNPLSWCP